MVVGIVVVLEVVLPVIDKIFRFLVFLGDVIVVLRSGSAGAAFVAVGAVCGPAGVAAPVLLESVVVALAVDVCKGTRYLYRLLTVIA